MYRFSFNCHISAFGQKHVLRRSRPLLRPPVDPVFRCRRVSTGRVDGRRPQHSARRRQLRCGARDREPTGVPDHRGEVVCADSRYRLSRTGRHGDPADDRRSAGQLERDRTRLARFHRLARQSSLSFRRASDQLPRADHVLPRAQGSRLVRSRRFIVGSRRRPRGASLRASACSRHLADRVRRPHMFETTEVAAHLQEGLLLALDDLSQIDPSSDRTAPNAGARSARLVQQIDDYVAAYPTAPIYTANLAVELGVSVRTLGGAVSKVRGMSLHQYIRLKRLGHTFAAAQGRWRDGRHMRTRPGISSPRRVCRGLPRDLPRGALRYAGTGPAHLPFRKLTRRRDADGLLDHASGRYGTGSLERRCQVRAVRRQPAPGAR